MPLSSRPLVRWHALEQDIRRYYERFGVTLFPRLPLHWAAEGGVTLISSSVSQLLVSTGFKDSANKIKYPPFAHTEDGARDQSRAEAR